MTTNDPKAKICSKSAMPGTSHDAEPFRVPLHHCRLKPNLPAGLNMLRVCAIADALRNYGRPITDPIRVHRLGPEDWLILEGRHRWMASYVAGVSDILAVEEDLA